MILSFYIPGFQAWRQACKRGHDTSIVIEHRGRVLEVTSDLWDVVNIGDSVDRVLRRHEGVTVLPNDPHFETVERECFERQLHQVSPTFARMFGAFYCIEIEAVERAQRIVERLKVHAGMAREDVTACFAAVQGFKGLVNIVADDFIKTFPVKDLAPFRIETEMIERLSLFGYQTAGQLQRLRQKHLTAQFGIDGMALYTLLHGTQRDRLPPWLPPKSISRTFHWEDPVIEPCQWEVVVERLCHDLASALEDKRATMIEVAVRGGDRPWKESTPLKRPTSHPQILTQRSLRMLRRARCSFMQMTVTCRGLVNPESLQMDVFQMNRMAVTAAEHEIIRRYPKALLDCVCVDPLSPLPEDRWAFRPRSI